MTATISAPAVHKAWLMVKAESASDDCAAHIHACNPCWSAITMPGVRRLCPVGQHLAGVYEAAAADQDVEVGR